MTAHSAPAPAPAPPPGPRLLNPRVPHTRGIRSSAAGFRLLARAWGLLSLLPSRPPSLWDLMSQVWAAQASLRCLPLTRSKHGLSTCSRGSIGRGLDSPASLQTQSLGLVL